MIHIVLCDDDSSMLSKMENEVSAFKGKQRKALDVVQYQDPLLLLDHVKENDIVCNILITDIDMPEMNGMELAEKVRKVNKDMVLIFITSHDEMVYSSIEHGPFRFIRKEFMHEEMELALPAACKCVEVTRSNRFVFKTKEGTRYIDTEEILYVDMDKRRSVLHCIEGKVITAWLTLNEVTSRLNELSTTFIRINKGIIVNIQHVTSIGKGELSLVDGSVLQVSRPLKSQVRKEILCFWGQNL